MARRRLIPLPSKGIDARQGLDVSPETWSFASNVRQSEGNVETRSWYLPAGTALATPGIPRNIVQMFGAPAGSDFNKLVMLTTTKAAVRANGSPFAWSNLETGYSLNGIGSLPYYPRFAVVNSRHQLAWTCAQAATPIKVRIYDGTTVTSITPNYSARYMIAFNNRLVLGDTMESSTRNSSRLRWCVNGNFTDWAGTGSGFLDVGSHASSGRILGLFNFGAIGIIALEHEVIELLPTRSLFPVFELGTHHRIPTVMAPRTWQTYLHLAFYVGADTVWAWDGSRATDIGKPISRLLAPLIDIVSVAYSLQAALLPSRGEYHLLATAGSGESQPYARLFVYDLKADRWFIDEVDTMRAIGPLLFIDQTDRYNIVSMQTTNEWMIGVTEGAQLQQETDSTFTSMPTPPDVILTTQNYLAVNKDGQPSTNAKNELVNVYFRTVPNRAVVAGYSIDKGATFTTQTVTADSEGVARFSATGAFSTVQLYFRRVAGTAAMQLTGPIEIEYEYIGEVY